MFVIRDRLNEMFLPLERLRFERDVWGLNAEPTQCRCARCAARRQLAAGGGTVPVLNVVGGFPLLTGEPLAAVAPQLAPAEQAAPSQPREELSPADAIRLGLPPWIVAATVAFTAVVFWIDFLIVRRLVRRRRS